MSYLPRFHLSPAADRPGASGPSAPPLMLCLDMRVHSPDESEGKAIGSSRGITPDESKGAGNSHGNSHGDTVDESEGEAGSTCGITLESEGTGSTRGNTPDPATSRSKGSFNWDWEKGGFSLEWASIAKFQMWRETEELVCSIEFMTCSTRTGQGILWSQ